MANEPSSDRLGSDARLIDADALQYVHSKNNLHSPKIQESEPPKWLFDCKIQDLPRLFADFKDHSQSRFKVRAQPWTQIAGDGIVSNLVTIVSPNDDD